MSRQTYNDNSEKECIHLKNEDVINQTKSNIKISQRRSQVVVNNYPENQRSLQNVTIAPVKKVCSIKVKVGVHDKEGFFFFF